MCLNHHKLEFLFSGYSTFIASCRLFFQPQRLLQTQVGNEKYTMCACRCPMTDPSWSRITFRVFQGGSVQISIFIRLVTTTFTFTTSCAGFAWQGFGCREGCSGGFCEKVPEISPISKGITKGGEKNVRHSKSKLALSTRSDISQEVG